MKEIRAIIFCALTLIVVASVHAAPPVPTGVFYLPSNRTLDPSALNNPNVDGAVIGSAWSDLEPSEGNYVFNTAASGQSLDSLLAQVEASNSGAGKPMRLAINTGGPGSSAGGGKPDWLISKITGDSYTGGKFFSYKDSSSTVTIPVFWEPTLLAKHALLAQAVADHLAGHPLVKIVFVPYANANSNDWNLGDTSNTAPDGIPPVGSTPQSRWLTALAGSGYATMEAALITAGNSTFKAYRAAFPDKILTTSIGRLTNYILNPDGANVSGRNISETVVANAAAAWPGYIVAQKNNLNGGGVLPAPGGNSAWNDLSVLHTTYGIPTAAQMVWHAYRDCAMYGAERMNAGTGSPCIDSTTTLKAAVDTGVTYATKWQELYELDILNLGSKNGDPNPGPVSDVISYAHQQLYYPEPPHWLPPPEK